MNTVKLLWQFKWVAVITLLLEWLILTPALVLMFRFADREVVFNMVLTPVGSSNFFGIFIDALTTTPGFIYSLLVFLVTIPTLLVFKLALAAGTIASMQTNTWSISTWFSLSGQHFLRSLGLLLRWLFVPAILCGLALLLFKLFGIESKTIKLAALAVCWFISLSWLFLSLNGIAQQQRWSLKNGAITLYKNLGQIAVAIIIFALLVAIIKLLNWQLFIANSTPESGFAWAMFGACFIALFMRLSILYWQAAHVIVWQKQWGTAS